MRVRGSALIAAALACAPGVARADSGAMFGESSRAASLAGSMTARPGDTSAIALSPGALADVDRPTAALATHLGALDLWYRRPGEDRVHDRRTIAGFGVSLAAPLPIGPEWLRAFRAGLAVHVPAQHALRLRAPSRPDEPSFPFYADRAERTALTATIATKLFSRIGVGVGITLAPTLIAPTRVGYDPARGSTAEEHVTVDLERELEIGTSAVAGLRTSVSDALSIGFAYRQAIVARAEGPNDTEAAGLVVRDRIDFHDFLAPEELAGGVAVFPSKRLGLSADLARARWSRYRTIHDAEPSPRFRDVVNLRVGAEWAASREIDLRAGYAFEPTPVPAQIFVTNLFDADRHVIAIGAGWDLRARGWAEMRIDMHARTHVVGTHRADKQAASLPDDDATIPGRQTTNLGHPSVEASGSFWQLGLTVSFFGAKGAGP